MSARTAEAQVLWDQLHALGQEAETLAALFRARPELVAEALALVLQAERDARRFGSPLYRALWLASPWRPIYAGSLYCRCDLLRGGAIGNVEHMERDVLNEARERDASLEELFAQPCWVGSLDPDSRATNDALEPFIGGVTRAEAMAAVDAALRDPERGPGWRLPAEELNW